MADDCTTSRQRHKTIEPPVCRPQRPSVRACVSRSHSLERVVCLCERQSRARSARPGCVCVSICVCVAVPFVVVVVVVPSSGYVCISPSRRLPPTLHLFMKKAHDYDCIIELDGFGCAFFRIPSNRQDLMRRQRRRRLPKRLASCLLG